jgi:excisionase family DNA binding protein
MVNPFEEILTELRVIKEQINAIPPGTIATPPEIIGTEELCRRLDLSEPTVIKWRKKKKIPFFTIGSSVRYNWPAVVQSLETKNQGR